MNNVDNNILHWLRAQISDSELREFLDSHGIDEYSTVRAIDLIKMLEEKEFPICYHNDYQFALFESGLSNINSDSPMFRIFTSVLFCYCNRLERFSPSIEGQYYMLGLEAVLELNDPKVIYYYLSYLESLSDLIPSKNKQPSEFFIWLTISIIYSIQPSVSTSEIDASLQKLEAWDGLLPFQASLSDIDDGFVLWRKECLKLVKNRDHLSRLMKILSQPRRVDFSPPSFIDSAD